MKVMVVVFSAGLAVLVGPWAVLGRAKRHVAELPPVQALTDRSLVPIGLITIYREPAELLPLQYKFHPYVLIEEKGVGSAALHDLLGAVGWADDELARARFAVLGEMR